MLYLIIDRIESNMITVKLKNLTLKFCFGFFFILAVSAVDADSYAVLSLIFCILHEFGHLAFMLIFKIKVSEIKLYGAGIKICSNGVDELKRINQTLIYFGGCLMNLLLYLVFSNIGLVDYALINLIICVLNLLPIVHFDGGKIFELYMPGLSFLRKVFSVLFSCFLFGIVIFVSVVKFEIISSYYIIAFVFIILCEMLE